MRKFVAVAICSIIICCIALTISPTAAGSSPVDTLTRGSRFTVTISGAPNTPYYVWVARTSTLSGKPGDQPPVIVGGQSGIEKDPPEGPYTIGTYAFSDGGGRTIRDDVAPSAPGMPDTNYYALVTTDRDGRAVVAFQTSSATATRTFSIRAENPRSSASVFIESGVPLRIPSTPPTVLPTLTSMTTPVPSVATPIMTTPALPAPTMSLPPATATPQQVPLSSCTSLLAGIAGGLLARKAGGTLPDL